MRGNLLHVFLLLFLSIQTGYATKHTITNDGFTFSPASLTAQSGDTLVFSIGNDHNVVEVSKTTWDANGTTSNGGFQLPFGGGMLVLTQPGVYYYVCEPHASQGMKARLTIQSASQADEVFVATLSGSQEVLPTVSTGQGEIRAELTGNQLVITGSFRDLRFNFNPNVSGGSHVHRGYAGENGSILFALTVSLGAGDQRGGTYDAAANRFALTSAQRDLLEQRRLYANIHTTRNAGGEIRGQVVPECQFVFQSWLSGTQEVTPVLSDGSGALVAEVMGNRLTVSGSLAGLSSAINTAIAGGAHLHTAFAGRNGGIRLGLTSELNPDNRSGRFMAAANSFTTGAAFADTLRARRIYANVHTQSFAGGEIRGQLLPASTAYFTTAAGGLTEVQPVNTTGRGALRLELTGSKLVVTGGFSDLASEFYCAGKRCECGDRRTGRNALSAFLDLRR